MDVSAILQWDGVKVATWIAALAAVATLVLALYLAFRNHDLRSLRLKFWFSYNPDSEGLPLSQMVVLAGSERMFPLVFQIKNFAKKPIHNVIVQLEYPERFALTDEEQNDLVRTDPRFQFIGVNERVAAIRQLTFVSGMAISRYTLGTLRAEEPLGSAEILQIPSLKRVSETDARFENKPYSTIDRLIREIPYVRDHLVVQAFVYSDVPRTQSNFLSITILRDKTSADVLDKFAADYVRAHWFGQYPKPGPYMLSPVRIWQTAKKRMWKQEGGEIQFLAESYASGDPQKIMHPIRQSFTLHRMPGYNYYRLPTYVHDTSSALWSLGFARIPNIKKLASRRLRRLLRLPPRGRAASKKT